MNRLFGNSKATPKPTLTDAIASVSRPWSAAARRALTQDPCHVLTIWRVLF